MRRSLSLLVLAPLWLAPAAGCAGDSPRWAVQHGTVDIGTDGIVGYQVWEMFSKRWGKKRSERQHICAQVQEMVGEAGASLPGCVGCAASYTIQTDLLEHDCAAPAAGLDGVTHFAFGPVPSELQGDEPHPGDTFGWYASFDGAALEPMGFAWNAALDEGDPPDDTGLIAGERFVFWPGWAWDLGE